MNKEEQIKYLNGLKDALLIAKKQGYKESIKSLLRELEDFCKKNNHPSFYKIVAGVILKDVN